MDENLKKKVDEQIANVTATSPAAQPQTVDEDAAVVAQNIAQTGIQAHPATPGETTVEEVAPGLKRTKIAATQGSRIKYRTPTDIEATDDLYDAHRPDAMSPATQEDQGVFLSDKGHVYLGGRALPGEILKAARPEKSDAFYLKSKFDPVKPYPLTMASGEKVMVDSANINKAMYQVMQKMEPLDDAIYLGYKSLGKAPEEGFFHGLRRSLFNWVTQMPISANEWYRLSQLDVREQKAQLLKNYEMVDMLQALRPQIIDDFEKIKEKYRWDWGPRVLGERQNEGEGKYGPLVGELVGQIGVAVALSVLTGGASAAAFGLMEGATDAVDARVQMYNAGVPTRRAHDISGRVGLASLALGFGPDALVGSIGSLGLGMSKIVRLAKESPKELKRLLMSRGAVAGLFQFVEGPQNTISDLGVWVASGQPINPETWEMAFLTALLSAGMGAVTASVSVGVTDPAGRIQKATEGIKNYIMTHEAALKAIVDNSGGAITWDNMTEIMLAMGEGEFGPAAVDYLRELYIGNLDKLSDEDRAVLEKRMAEIGTSDALEKEFENLDARVKEMLDRDGGDLTEEQKNFIRFAMRGIAGFQFLRLGIKPSEMALPITVKGTVEGALSTGQVTDTSRIGGYASDEGGIYVNNQALANRENVPQAKSSGAGLRGQRTAASVRTRNDYAQAIRDGAPNVATDRSAQLGNLMHEVQHWMQNMTGLPSIGEYMQKMNELVESIIPGYLKGKSGVELAEAMAYAMQYADKGVKEALGLAGDNANYLDMMYAALSAADTTGKLRAISESFRDIMANNEELVTALVDEFGEQPLRKALRNYIENGDPSILSPENLRALNAVLNTYSNLNTAAQMERLFDGPEAMNGFMTRYGRAMDELMWRDAAAVRARRDATRAEADQKVGLDKKPQVNDVQTVESKMADVAASESPVETVQSLQKRRQVAEYELWKLKDNKKLGSDEEQYNAERKKLEDTMADIDKKIAEAKRKETDKTPAKAPAKKPSLKFSDVAASENNITLEGAEPVLPNRSRVNPGEEAEVGSKYHRDMMLSGDMFENPALMVKYREWTDKFVKEWGAASELDNYQLTVTGSADPNVPSGMKLTPSTGVTKKDAAIAYAIASRAAVRKMRELGRFNESQTKELQDKGLFAVTDGVYSVMEEPIELLAQRVANTGSGDTNLFQAGAGKASKAEINLYRTLSKFEQDLSGLYVEYGPYTPLENAYRAKALTERVIMDLAEMDRSDPMVSAILTGDVSIYDAPRQLHEQVVKALGKEVKTTTIEDAISNYYLHLEEYILAEEAQEDLARKGFLGGWHHDTGPVAIARDLLRHKGMPKKAASLQENAGRRKALEAAYDEFDRYRQLEHFIEEDYREDRITKQERDARLKEIAADYTAATKKLDSLGGVEAWENEVYGVDSNDLVLQMALDIVSNFDRAHPDAFWQNLASTETWQKMPEEVKSAWKTLHNPKAIKGKKGQARQILSKWFTQQAISNDPLQRFFAPDYNEDYSERFVGAKTLSAAEAVETADPGAAQILEEAGVLADYRNPVRGYLKRDIINSPTPLQELGITAEEARARVIAAGLQPFEFDREAITNTYLGMTYNSDEPNAPYMTRRRLLAKLLKGVPSIESPRYKQVVQNALKSDKPGRREMAKAVTEHPVENQLRVLLAIEDAKMLADSIFKDYIGREESFNKYPSLHQGVMAASMARYEAYRQDKPEQYNRIFGETWKNGDKVELGHYYRHRTELGYSQLANPTRLHVGEEIAFLYGNNVMRAVVSFVGRTPAKEKFYVLRRAVDLDAWRAKDLTPTTSGLKDLVLSAKHDMTQVPILKKPVSDTKYVEELFDFVDKALEKMGQENWTAIAEMSRADANEEIKQRSIAYKHGGLPQTTAEDFERARAETDTAEELAQETKSFSEDSMDDKGFAEYDSEEGGHYSVSDDLAADPGAFIMSEEDLARYQAELAADFGANAADVIAHDIAKQEGEPLKPKFSDKYGAKKGREGVSKMYDEAIADVKERKINKVALVLGWGGGLDRKGRIGFGAKFWNKHFGLAKAASEAETISQRRRHVLDQATLANACDGSQTKFNKWLLQKNIDQFDATLANGMQVKVSEDEIITMALAVEAKKRNLIKSSDGESLDVESRLRAFYGNETFDELLTHLSDVSRKFVEHVAFENLNAQRISEVMPAYWIPVQTGEQYIKNGWNGRSRNKPNDSLEILASNAPLAALGAYDSIITLIGNASMKMSGMLNQIGFLKDFLLFADVDRSQFRDFDFADEALYNQLVAKSAELRQLLQEKMGKTFSKWFYDNITTELEHNPALKDIATNPFMRGFQNLTRMKAVSVLTGNIRQGLHNMGNYHMFLGLSNSSMAKFYTVDWANAAAHFREAWALAMSIPEFRRRWEQAGLSEQMRRAADMNSESFLQEIQVELYKKGKLKTGDLIGMADTFNKIASKYGLLTNVGPDMISIALGTYAVWEDVLAKNRGNKEKAKAEIVDHILNRVSSSNYMTRSAMTKLLNKMGLEAVVMFQNDQLQKAGTLAEAIITLQNSTDPDERKKAWKDIEAVTYSTLRYIAIQAGWLAALAQLMGGDELSDEEMDYLIESTVRETLTQIGGATQFGNMVTPILTGVWEGTRMAPGLLPFGAAETATTAFRKGKYLKGGAEVLSDAGVFGPASAAVRIIDGVAKILSDEPHEAGVGWLQLSGRAEATAMNMLGLSRSQTTGRLQLKKSETKAQKERKERKREAARAK